MSSILLKSHDKGYLLWDLGLRGGSVREEIIAERSTDWIEAAATLDIQPGAHIAGVMVNRFRQGWKPPEVPKVGETWFERERRTRPFWGWGYLVPPAQVCDKWMRATIEEVLGQDLAREVERYLGLAQVRAWEFWYLLRFDMLDHEEPCMDCGTQQGPFHLHHIDPEASRRFWHPTILRSDGSLDVDAAVRWLAEEWPRYYGARNDEVVWVCVSCHRKRHGIA